GQNATKSALYLREQAASLIPLVLFEASAERDVLANLALPKLRCLLLGLARELLCLRAACCLRGEREERRGALGAEVLLLTGDLARADAVSLNEVALDAPDEPGQIADVTLFVVELLVLDAELVAEALGVSEEAPEDALLHSLLLTRGQTAAKLAHGSDE